MIIISILFYYYYYYYYYSIEKKVQKELELKQKREKRILEKKQKRKKYEIQLKLKSLTLPEDDIRRNMMQTLMRLIGNSNILSIKKFFEDNAVPQLLYRIVVVVDKEKCQHPFVLPKKTLIRGYYYYYYYK